MLMFFIVIDKMERILFMQSFFFKTHHIFSRLVIIDYLQYFLSIILGEPQNTRNVLMFSEGDLAVGVETW